MGFIERGRAPWRAARLAAALLCAACQFDSTPLSSHGDLATATVNGDAHARASGFDNPGSSQGASPSTTANPSSAAQPAREDAASPTARGAQAGSGSSAQAGSAGTAALDAAAGPTAEPDAAAPELGPADPGPGPGPDAQAQRSDGAAPALPAPGAPFSRCSGDGDCGEGLVCTSTLAALSGQTGQPGYCATRCDWSTGTPACTQPDSGLVKASCQLGGMLCLLGSCERSVCPNGLECAETQTPIGAGQVVTFFACQP